MNGDLLPGAIRGISRTSIWRSWKTIRKELRNATIRDVVDFLDYDVNPDVWINRLLARIKTGHYETETPTRFTLGKSKGFSRTMTLPAIPDLVLYRTIVDHIYACSRGRRHRNVYFLRDELSQAQKKALDEALGRMAQASDDGEFSAAGYRFPGQRSFYNWLRFDQYRKHLIYDQVHPYIVVTDVANFFDTILHSHVAQAVQSLRVPPRMVGLLFFLLEHLSFRQDFSSSHGISLPTDEFDCSRTLAHMVLFPHDDAMVRVVGEANYVRWMDDQNMGVETKAAGSRVLQEVGKSLGRLHLTPNAQKSKILPLGEARRHYHLDVNKELDDLEILSQKSKTNVAARTQFRWETRRTWRSARQHESVGEFSKILKRIYRLAGLARLRLLRNRAKGDLLADPSLVERICDYLRCTGSTAEYIDFMESAMGDPEQIYPDVNIALSYSLLRLEPQNTAEKTRIRLFTKSLIKGDRNIPGAAECGPAGALLALRFGDLAIMRLLRARFNGGKRNSSASMARACAFVYGSQSAKAFGEVKDAAAHLLKNHLSTLVRLMLEIQKYKSLPKRYSQRMNLSTDSVAGTQYVDMRTVLTARLLLLSPKAAVKQWVIKWRTKTLVRPGIKQQQFHRF